MKSDLRLLRAVYGKKAVERAAEVLAELEIEVPSWGFGRGGTRFGSYPDTSDARTVEDKIERARQFYARTGQGRRVALHFPWDGETAEDIRSLAAALRRAGLEAGAVNSNLFTMREASGLDHRLRYGSLTNPDKEVREAAVRHNLDCVRIIRILGSKTLSLWLPDGTNSPGQMSFYDQADRLDECIRAIARALRPGENLLIEYKIFEPGMYSTAIPDYSRALALCEIAGKNSGVLVDLGHHAPTTNIEQIVAFLLRAERLGGFHFNDKKYADDDLAAGSIDPAQLFRIFVIILEAVARRLVRLKDIAFMIDESHQIKDPLEEMVESATNIEIALAKAALVDFDQLWRSQRACDISAADGVLHHAFHADVRPLVEAVRAERLRGVR
ncbi:MAG: TIM barrel protein, partial [Planctomycetota bacterium]|nr:TIM barrel protein [Planctomycetota bacterium]